MTSSRVVQDKCKVIVALCAKCTVHIALKRNVSWHTKVYGTNEDSYFELIGRSPGVLEKLDSHVKFVSVYPSSSGILHGVEDECKFGGGSTVVVTYSALERRHSSTTVDLRGKGYSVCWLTIFDFSPQVDPLTKGTCHWD